jgi:CO/xanthine dehydrogenase Mo-binding subunit
VQLINSREEDFLATRPREPMQVRMRVGFMRDGVMSGKEVRVTADNGAYANLGPPVGRTATLRHDHMFLNGDLRSELRVVYTNNVPRGAFRGFGNPSGQWAMQQMVDMGARALGLDPREVWLKNAIEENHLSPHGARIASCELKACVERATDAIGWEAKRANRQPNRGLGLAASVMVSGRRSYPDFDGAQASITLEMDGTLQLASGEGETGPGTTTVLAQIAAEEIGARYQDVVIGQADTATTRYAYGAHGSRATYVAGNAVRQAAQRAREEILRVASELLEVSANDLEIADSVVRVRGVPGPTRTLTLAEVATRGLFRRNGQQISVVGAWDAPSDQADATEYSNESGSYNFCAQALEVDVDPSTGQFRILNATMASDAGTVIHPIACEGQNEGALAQGLGYAAIEDLVIEDGRPLNPNFSDYRVPSLADMPPFRQEFVPSYEPTGPFGAKGIGQVGIDPVAPALANAIFDAVGVRVTSLPITPEKVLWALRARKDA